MREKYDIEDMMEYYSYPLWGFIMLSILFNLGVNIMIEIPGAPPDARPWLFVFGSILLAPGIIIFIVFINAGREINFRFRDYKPETEGKRAKIIIAIHYIIVSLVIVSFELYLYYDHVVGDSEIYMQMLWLTGWFTIINQVYWFGLRISHDIYKKITNKFITFIGDIDIHDGTILKVEQEGDRVRVFIRGASRRELAVEFLGVKSIKSNRPEGMFVLSLKEMKTEPPYRLFVFDNWVEEDDACLEILARAFRESHIAAPTTPNKLKYKT